MPGPTPIPIEEWLDSSDALAALTTDGHDIIYLVWVGGESENPLVCVNTRTNAVFRIDARVCRIMFGGIHVTPIEIG